MNPILTATMSRLRVRQTSVFMCEMRAFFVCLMCCKVCSELESSVLIQGSLGGSADYKYASYASRRRETGVCREGQGRHRCLRTWCYFLKVVTVVHTF